MRFRILLVVIVSCPPALYSQTSAYQSADGTSSIFLNNAKANLVFNVSSAQFSVGYLIEKEAPSWEYGINFSGKPSTDLTNQIFQSSNSPASINIGGAFGRNGIVFKGAMPAKPGDIVRADWGVAQISYTRATFNTVAASSTSVVAQHFNGFTVLPTYDALYNVKGFNILMGLAAGVNETNNVNSLKQVNVTTTDSQSNTTSVISQQSAYLGNYATAVGVPVYSDFVFIPKIASWLSIDAFERANVATTNRYAEGGVGMFIAKPDAPTQVLGGISIGWKDGTRTIALVAGWAF